MISCRKFFQRDGLSLTETVIVAAIALFGLTAIAALLANVLLVREVNENLLLATDLAQTILEKFRNRPWNDIVRLLPTDSSNSVDIFIKDLPEVQSISSEEFPPGAKDSSFLRLKVTKRLSGEPVEIIVEAHIQWVELLRRSRKNREYKIALILNKYGLNYWINKSG